MIVRTILRALSRIRLFDLDWYEEMKRIADDTRRQHERRELGYGDMNRTFYGRPPWDQRRGQR